VNQTNATKRIGISVETTLDAEFGELELWAEPMFGSLLWFAGEERSWSMVGGPSMIAFLNEMQSRRLIEEALIALALGRSEGEQSKFSEAC